MSLEVGRATEDTTLRAAVGGLVGMNPLVCTETTLVWQQHLAYLASLGKNTKKANNNYGKIGGMSPQTEISVPAPQKQSTHLGRGSQGSQPDILSDLITKKKYT